MSEDVRARDLYAIARDLESLAGALKAALGSFDPDMEVPMGVDGIYPCDDPPPIPVPLPAGGECLPMPPRK